MIRSDGRRGDDFHRGTVQQGGIATGTGTDQQGIGIPDIFRTDFPPLFIDHAGVGFQHTFQEGNRLVRNNFRFLK